MSDLVQSIAENVKNTLSEESTGHDWWHVQRVWNMAKRIGQEEQADMLVVELAALLHDIADWKFHDGDDSVGPRVSREVMQTYQVPQEIIDHVCEIISGMSYKGAGVETSMRTIEGKIVQDADRLEAIGAIGIARAFAYGGYKGCMIHDPLQAPVMHQTKEEYVNASGTTINHFYEKLLFLKGLMNTEFAKKIAEDRHKFIEEFLIKFNREWEGLE